MKQKINSRNKDELIAQSKGLKKIHTECYEKEPLKIEPYLLELNLADARVIFRRNFQLLQSVQLNFKNDPKFRAGGYLCIQCLALDPQVRHLDSQDALLDECQANRDLHVKYNLNDLQQEASFYREITERRNQLSGG